MTTSRKNLFLSTLYSSKNNSSSNLFSSESSSTSPTSNGQASPAPDFLFVNKAYRDRVHARSPSASGSGNVFASPRHSVKPPHSTLPPAGSTRVMPNGALFSAPERPPPVKSSSDNLTPNFVNEKQRIKLLRELDLLDCDASEEAFDRITNMASRIFKCPIAAISFMDETRQYFKSRLGMPVSFMPRDVSFNTLTFLDNHHGVIVIRDTCYDDRFIPPEDSSPPPATAAEGESSSSSVPATAALHPNGTEYDPDKSSDVFAKYKLPVHPFHHSPAHYHRFLHLRAHIRFFATTNIFVGNVKVGCLTVADSRPHEDFSERDEAVLLDLAGTISDLLEVRRVARREEELKTVYNQQDALLRLRPALHAVMEQSATISDYVQCILQSNPATQCAQSFNTSSRDGDSLSASIDEDDTVAVVPTAVVDEVTLEPMEPLDLSTPTRSNTELRLSKASLASASSSASSATTTDATEATDATVIDLASSLASLSLSSSSTLTSSTWSSASSSLMPSTASSLAISELTTASLDTSGKHKWASPRETAAASMFTPSHELHATYLHRSEPVEEAAHEDTSSTSSKSTQSGRQTQMWSAASEQQFAAAADDEDDDVAAEDGDDVDTTASTVATAPVTIQQALAPIVVSSAARQSLRRPPRHPHPIDTTAAVPVASSSEAASTRCDGSFDGHDHHRDDDDDSSVGWKWSTASIPFHLARLEHQIHSLQLHVHFLDCAIEEAVVTRLQELWSQSLSTTSSRMFTPRLSPFSSCGSGYGSSSGVNSGASTSTNVSGNSGNSSSTSSSSSSTGVNSVASRSILPSTHNSSPSTSQRVRLQA